MLTYEYECEVCGLRFERRQSIAEDPLTECPDCRGNFHRLVSGGAGFILGGAGQSRAGQRGSEISLEQMGTTCCGRDERCGKPPCWEES